jgi:CopG family nickel-responsive transcriptional regulator
MVMRDSLRSILAEAGGSINAKRVRGSPDPAHEGAESRRLKCYVLSRSIIDMARTVRFSVSVDEGLLDQFDRLCRERGWSNRSEAIRDAIRSRLVEEQWSAGEEVAGVITLLYDHHQPGLAERVTRIQHHALQAVISSTHVHVDDRNCLEFIAVKGSADAILALRDELLGLKGVKHGELTATSTGKGID